ncbi:amidohydrolase family protein [Streptomyces sp. NPDC017082]|uniref:metal-dependent hydrolase family protein n=1 Tax=Streptomyces sp. NPDC017082 TaxID=3364974 RepID=UPI0037B0CB87
MTAGIVTADRVLLGPVGQVIEGGAVLFADEVIQAVGPLRDIVERAPSGAVRADFPGGSVLPGLIDCHVHLVFDAGEDPLGSLSGWHDHDLLLAMAGRARQLLDSGVTTARDLGDRGNLAGRLRDAIAAGHVPGPRLLTAGAPVTVTGGHCWVLGGQADGVEGVRAQVRRTLRDGADLVKIMVSGGTLTAGGPPNWQPQYTPEEIRTAVREARRFGRPVAAHAHSTEGIAAAVAAGVDTIEHCTFTEPPAEYAVGRTEHADGRADAGVPSVAALVRAIADRGIAVCPTLHGGINDLPPHLVDQDELGRLLRQIGDHHAAGVRLIAGTDAGVPGAGFGRYAESLDWFTRAGLAPEDVLRIATVDSARALGLGGRTGRIATGLDADLLVVAGDPREDLTVLRRPEAVVIRGRWHVPSPAARRNPVTSERNPA